MHKRDLMAVGSWIGIAVALWVIAWIISTAIPVFSNLLSLMVSWSYMQTSKKLLANSRPIDSIIRELVQFWSSRYLLAISQQGTVVLFAQEDSPGLCQHDVHLHWHYHGMFGLAVLRTIRVLTVSVWSWSLLYRQSYP